MEDQTVHITSETNLTNSNSSISDNKNINIFRKKLQNAFEILFRWMFFWETDDKRIGTFIRVIHQYFLMAIIITFILVHTILPNYIYLFFLWLTATVIWILHITTGSCVLTKIEHKLTGEKITVADPFLDLFYIPKTKENIMGITLMSSTVFFVFLSFELIARTSLNIHSFLKKSPFSFFL